MKVVEEKIARPLGMDVYQAAEGIVSIIDATMGSTLTTNLAARGLDPSKFVLFAFGGGGPTHCAGYSNGIGFKDIIVPRMAAVFSAFGASTSNITHRHEASPFALVPSLPYDVVSLKFKKEELKIEMVPQWARERFNKMVEDLEAAARADMHAEGYKEGEYNLRYEILARYGGQLYEIRVEIFVSRIKVIQDLAKILESFEDEYMKVYTREAMVPAGGIEIVTVAVEAIGMAPKPKIVKGLHVGKSPKKAEKGRRDVYFSGRFITTPVYAWELLGNGNEIKGPTIIESSNTTLVVPPDRRVRVDEYNNIHMSS